MFDLYILETCPYCRKVMNFFDENNIEYNKKNISDKTNRDELIKLGDKSKSHFFLILKSQMACTNLTILLNML